MPLLVTYVARVMVGTYTVLWCYLPAKQGCRVDLTEAERMTVCVCVCVGFVSVC